MQITQFYFADNTVVIIDGKVKADSAYFKFEEKPGTQGVRAGQPFHKTIITHDGKGKKKLEFLQHWSSLPFLSDLFVFCLILSRRIVFRS